MPNKIARFITFLLSLAFCGGLLSCVTDNAPLQIENSLQQSEIAYFNDSFDRMREDLWDRTGYINKNEQMRNFKQADMRFENGKLIIHTKTGSFSKGGLGSNFRFRGDFDIQLDCRIDFLKGVSGMNQLLNFMVLDMNKKTGKADFVVILLFIGEGEYQGWLYSRGLKNGRWNDSSKKRMDKFDGSLRFVRNGKRITSLYKKRGASAWNKIKAFNATGNDMGIGFTLRNYFTRRTTIRAKHSIFAEFDNFQINAAHQIIEAEI